MTGYDIVLGIEWLITLGPSKWDFEKLTISFEKEGITTVLQGIPHTQINLMKGDHLKKLLKKGNVTTIIQIRSENKAQFFSLSTRAPNDIPEDLQQMLDDFNPIFQWLNSATIKDKFPIPVIEELMEELYRSRFFSKLDLRSGFHQIRMHPGKCNFGCKQISYIGHILYENGVATNPAKLKAMSTWPVPESPKQLKGFLGLAGYYRRFIKGYGSIVGPITALLKKCQFEWNKEAKDAFLLLKQRMLSPPVLALPNFNIPFVVDTDASGIGIGAGKKNLVADVLSRRVAGVQCAGISVYHTVVQKQIQESYEEDPNLAKVIREILANADSHPECSYDQGMLRKRDRLVVGKNNDLRNTLIAAMHLRVEGGHSGTLVTQKKMQLVYSWPEMLTDIREFVRTCEVCQKNKPDNSAYRGLLQPLAISNRFWESVSMDFIESLPKSKGDSRVEEVDVSLTAREASLQLIKFHLKRAQNRMKQQQDKKRKDVTLQVGSWALVKLQPYRQRSIQKLFHKLSPKYFGSFEVLERIGEVAYKLELGTDTKIHNVFHVSQLKSFQGTPATIENIPQLSTQPNMNDKIVGEQDIMVHGKMKKQLLINWDGAQTEDQTWEDAEVISIQCPEMLAARRQTRQHSLRRG
ncbi:uncharacterized protein LOC124913355 [Impatiens glandulifera]|uniref:uncharacterized protein LOC124913355 n=1 Tax=Impatiens glandulifera TaxID=253017 RepID=UPI001FB0B053|nr:uncharacterized protein LOC124913355 [Impatiens glandulifera]